MPSHQELALVEWRKRVYVCVRCVELYVCLCVLAYTCVLGWFSVEIAKHPVE